MEINQGVNPADNVGNAENSQNVSDKGTENPVKPSDEAGKKENPNPQDVKQAEKNQDPNKENPQDHDWKKRYDNTARDFKKTSEEYQRTIETNQKLVEKNPQVLDSIAEFNTDLADQISQKLYGKSYDQHREFKRIESLKETDPEKATLEETRFDLTLREQKLSDQIKNSFYESKNIIFNKFDPNFQKVEEQLKVINPDFVRDNLSTALGIAYNLAFPGGVKANSVDVQGDNAMLQNVSKSGGGAGSGVGDGNVVPPANKKNLSATQTAFLSKFKNLTQN